MSRLALLPLLLLLATSAAAADWERQLPGRARPGVDEPLADAIQVWRLGATYVDGVSFGGDPMQPPRARPFTGLDDGVASFLQAGMPASAVQFSGAVGSRGVEAALRGALAPDRPPPLRLLALTILVKRHAPRSAREQWEALQSLRGKKGHPGLPWLFEQLEAEFAPRRVRALLERPVPEGRYDDDRTLEWAARVAGVRGDVVSIPRLVELSTGGNLHASLAATKSLIDLPGAEADRALARTVEGWRYDAFVRAGNALLRRDPALLERTLLAMPAPARSSYWYAVFLGRCGNPEAVPLLCETVGGVQRIDGEMFELIGKLATAEHRAQVEALPDRVREKQRERAVAVRDEVLARLDERPTGR